MNLQNPVKRISHHQDSLVQKESNSEARAGQSSKGTSERGETLRKQSPNSWTTSSSAKYPRAVLIVISRQVTHIRSTTGSTCQQ